MSSVIQTLEQRRAQKAWEFVSNCLDAAIERLEQAIKQAKDEKERNNLKDRLNKLRKPEGADQWKGKYGSLVRKMPSYILTNGLGQTLAFLKAKGRNEPDSEHEILYCHLSKWLRERLGINGDVLHWITVTDSHQYRRATMEALAFLQWLKRFAEAELPKGREE